MSLQLGFQQHFTLMVYVTQKSTSLALPRLKQAPFTQPDWSVFFLQKTWFLFFVDDNELSKLIIEF